MSSRAGIERFAVCEKGTLATTPAKVIAAMIMGKSSVVVSDFKSVKDRYEREFRNMKNIKVETEILQPTMGMVKNALTFLDGNCDIQAVTTAQASGTRDVFKFAGTSALGLDFELDYSLDKKSLKLTAEKAFSYDTFITMMTGAASATEKVMPVGEVANINNWAAPDLLLVESPEGTALLTADDFMEMKLNIKTKGQKDIKNMSDVDSLVVDIEIKSKKAAMSELVTLLNKDIAPSMLIKFKNKATYYDAFKIAANTIPLVTNLDINDENRTTSIKFSATLPIGNFSVDLGTANGGGDTDTLGLLGGTLNIG